MELIVADSAGRTLFNIADFELDMDAGWGDGVDNTFDLIVRDASAPLPEAAWRVFADGTEMGGRVEGFELKTGRTSSELHWTGSTWTGVLAKRLLWPDAGQDYLTLSGDANAVLRSAVARLGLGSFFAVPDSDAGVAVSYRCSRDVPDAWTNLRLAMRSAGLRLDAKWVNGACRLQAVRVTDWRGRVDSDLVDFDLTSDLLVTNHLKAAGKGELASREVVDVYADRNGNVGTSKAMAGVFELEEYYDANNSEGDDLRKQAVDRLKDMQADGGVKVTVGEGVSFGLGDIVEARHYSPNVTVSVEVSSRVTTATGAGASVTYGATPVTTRIG
nr:MAG TPA: hypothetical protein [Caudoviricetes sp.]